ncbi:MAG: hypothetical protein JXA69_10625, partial [Phycisphaerae bacterium]|nr:hypothetical protein [Phycisphaerae bacterium]
LWSRRPRALNEFPSPDVFTQIVATLAVLSLLAMLAIAAAVHAHVRWERARRWDPARAGRRPLPPLAWTVVTVSLLVGALWVMGAPAWPWVAVPYGVVWPRWLASFGALTLGLIPPMLLLKPLYRRNAVGGPIVGLWLLLVWLVPMLVDLIVNVAMVPEEQARVTWLFGCSPLGALILIWKIESVSFLPGLAFAGALALLVAILTRPRTRPPVCVNPVPSESSLSSEQTRTE